MTLPMFSPALDTAAVEAMVSMVGTYTLDALRDSESRAQHKQKCAERLKTSLARARTVPYSDQAVLANLDWGIDSLEEAITTNNGETKVARLDHAEKMLQVCALLDSRAATAGVSNCYLSAWAHFNLAFVWKLRDNDRKAANHMLQMFLVDPFFSRVDFAPALWEHLFLPHLSNIVNWYTKQRKSVVVSGAVRKMSEEQEMSSFDVSRDFTSNSANVLQQLSAGQTSQLQALENLFQESLDENTRQYARYYEDWLKSDLANGKGMPLMPIPEPPMTPIGEPWVPLPTDEVPSSAGTTMPVDKPVLLEQVTRSSMSLSRHSDSALPPLQEFNDFDHPEFVELAEFPTVIAGDGQLDDDPDSPNSNFRRPGWEHQKLEPTSTSNRHSESAGDTVIRASTDQNTPSSTKLLSTADSHSDLESSFGFSSPTQPSIHMSDEIRAVPNSGEIRSVLDFGDIKSDSNSGEIRSVHNYGEIRSVPNSGEIRSAPNYSGEISSAPNSREIRTDSGSEPLGDSLELKVPQNSRSFRQQPDALDYYPAGADSTPKTVNRKLSELRDTTSSPRRSHDSPRARTGPRASKLNNSSSSRYSDSESIDRKLDSMGAESQPQYEEFESDVSRHVAGLQQTEGFNQSSNDSSNEYSLPASTTIRAEAQYSSNDFSDSEASGAQIQDRTLDPGQNSLRDSRATGKASTTRSRFLSKYGNKGSAGSTLLVSKWYQNDEYEPIVAHSGPLLGRASDRYNDDDDEPIVARSGPLLGSASQTYQNGDNEPIVARSGPLLETASQSYQNDDDEPIVARSGPLLGSASERYQDDDDKPISKPIRTRSGPLLGRASQRYQNGDDEPILAWSGPLLSNASVDSGLAREQRRSPRHRKSESWGSTRNSPMATPLTRPPKDFVCPITRQLFKDPVTLETGQTYERVAIQERLNRGILTCPITSQILRENELPKTNYLLKRLVDAWKEQYPELAIEFGSYSLMPRDASGSVKPSSEFTERSAASNPYIDSPGSRWRSSPLSRRIFTNNNVSDISTVGSPIDVQGLIMDLQPAMSSFCTSENLAECENLLVGIARLVLQARGDRRLVCILNKAGAIARMMDLLFNSQEARVLDATLFLLSVVIATDDTARQSVVSADPEAGCFVGLVRKGLTSSATLLYQLKLPKDQLAALDLFPLLVVMTKENEENHGVDTWNEQQDILSMMMRPKSAAIMLLDQILMGGDPATFSQNSQALLALQAIPALVSSLDQTKNIDVRTSAISLLLCCIKSDGRSRNMIAKIIDLATVVDLLHSGSDRARTVAITFLNELVHLSRRALCTDVLRRLKAKGSLSSMRVLLVYLQMAPLEHRPAAASLLLQLDLLQEPRKGSMYREEALDSLVKALNSTDWACPAEAANTLIALGGRFSHSGKPMMKAWLLKISGIDKYFLSLTKNEQDHQADEPAYDQEEEERAAKAWERKVAGALVGHDSGTLIEALGQGIQSKNPEVSKPCMIVATWVTHMMPKFPDTGIRQTARNCLLDHFVGVLHTSKDLQQRALAALAIHSFISDPEGVQELISYVKDISGPLRQLKKSTWTAKEILHALITHGNVNSPNLWVHAEQGQLDVTTNGEVRALVKAKTRIFSGHSDGTIKIWEVKKRFPVLLQELKEHAKSVMALTVSLNSNRMYSGSLDKSIRVWALGAEDIRCVHVFYLKDAVVGLLVNGLMACIIPHGAGLKVQYEESATKTLNSNKHVQSLAISDGKIFCGCTDNSVQELDPISECVDIIQHGVRTLIGKKPIYSIQVFQDHLYSAGAPVDGVAGKVRKLSDHSLVGTICTPSEVRSMAISEDFIYLGSNSGVIEVWLRERLLRVSTLNPGSKVICLMLDGETLYSGHEDGKIRIWTMM